MSQRNGKRKSDIKRLPPIEGGRLHLTGAFHPVDWATIKELARIERCSVSMIVTRMINKYIGTAEDEV
jgi:hypothetical protein